MKYTFVVLSPDSERPNIIVEVWPCINLGNYPEAELNQLKKRLYESRVLSGMLVTPEKTYFLRDTFKALTFSLDSYRVNDIKTSELFELTHKGKVHSEAALASQVKEWLYAVRESWYRSVSDAAMPFVLHSILGGLVDADIQEGVEKDLEDRVNSVC